MTVPYWVEDAIFYQIFPDRFANGDANHLRDATLPWDAAPTPYGFQGGDLRGVIQRFDYLLDLGINAIYFNPIFQATSTHRYNTSDYFRIDNKLGNLNDFKSLINLAHANGVRIILDGVFNHCGRGFFAFNDLLENQDHSPYKDWFYVKHFPVRAYNPGTAEDYLGWWGYKTLPKLNTATPAVRQYILDVARYWIVQGADGWRLDVPNEIDDDDFWAEYRRVVRSANPEAYLLGEIWTLDPRWVGEKTFDGLMNYPLREALLKWLKGEETVTQFSERIDKIQSIYTRENAYAMLLMLGTHDTERILTAFNGDLAKTKLAYLFQLTYPGAPSIYYGDEYGMEGGKDPGCRHTFDWDESHWKTDLHQWVRQLVQLRKTHLVLRRGEFRRVWSDNARGGYAFSRTLGEQAALVVFNASGIRRNLLLPVSELGWGDGRIVRNLLEAGEYIVSGDALAVMINPWSGMIIA